MAFLNQINIFYIQIRPNKANLIHYLYIYAMSFLSFHYFLSSFIRFIFDF